MPGGYAGRPPRRSPQECCQVPAPALLASFRQRGRTCAALEVSWAEESSAHATFATSALVRRHGPSFIQVSKPSMVLSNTACPSRGALLHPARVPGGDLRYARCRRPWLVTAAAGPPVADIELPARSQRAQQHRASGGVLRRTGPDFLSRSFRRPTTKSPAAPSVERGACAATPAPMEVCWRACTTGSDHHRWCTLALPAASPGSSSPLPPGGRHFSTGACRHHHRVAAATSGGVPCIQQPCADLARRRRAAVRGYQAELERILRLAAAPVDPHSHPYGSQLTNRRVTVDRRPACPAEIEERLKFAADRAVAAAFFRGTAHQRLFTMRRQNARWCGDGRYR